MFRKLIVFVLIAFLGFSIFKRNGKSEVINPVWWEFQSIDTMKFSRDIAREKNKDANFNLVVDQQVKHISQTGATHIAVGTPYDEEFLPFLNLWVQTARKYGLNVWFRGNWAGWEKWFGYPPLDRDQHIAKTLEFIIKNSDLFRDNDIFSPCPECENGGPGDPRINRDVAGHRQFLIKEHELTRELFGKLNKNVKTNFLSMNGDVARLIMDKDTTKKLDGIVVVDHYVKSPEKLASDLKNMAQSSGGKIVLGEFGAPVPDIHGKFSSDDQANWIRETFENLSNYPEIIGVNYWVGTGGSTELWLPDGTEKPAVSVISSFFKPNIIKGSVLNEISRPIAGVIVNYKSKSILTDKNGNFTLPYSGGQAQIEVVHDDYHAQNYLVDHTSLDNVIVMKKIRENWLFRFRKFINRII